MTVLAMRPAPATNDVEPRLPAPLVTGPPDQLLIRAAVAGDSPALGAMHDRCSLDTRFARWHAPIRNIPASYLAEVTGSLPTHAAVVASQATSPSEIIGLASACLISPGVWELGMLVEDTYQRQGVGRALLRVLVAEVARRGGRQLLAVSLDERRAVLRGLHELGPVTMSSRATTVTARVLLAG